MTTRILLQLCILLTFALASCKQQTDVAEVRKAIEEADARQSNAFATKDLTGLTANYAPDAVILPENGPMVSGREGIDAFFKEMSDMVSDFRFSMTKLDASGDLAYEVGTYSGMMGSMSDNGKFVTVWKRQADGQWKIVADIFNTNLPLPSPPVDEEKKQ